MLASATGGAGSDGADCDPAEGGSRGVDNIGMVIVMMGRKKTMGGISGGRCRDQFPFLKPARLVTNSTGTAGFRFVSKLSGSQKIGTCLMFFDLSCTGVA